MDINEAEEKIFARNDESLQEEDKLPLSRQGQNRQTKKAKKRSVSFPEDDRLVSESVEPVDPWANASSTTSSEVISAYMNTCARLRVKPIDKLVKQLKEHDVIQNRINILDLKGIKLDVKSCEALEEIFKRVQVHMLDIENTNLEDEGAIAIIEMIEFYQSALHICIGFNPRIKTRGWQIFSQMIRKVQFVEFMDIRHCCFNDPCAAVMARSLKLNTTLKILHLEGDNLSGKLLLILCTGIKFNQSISELFLGDNFMVPSDASTLSAMLKSNTTLQLLDVRNNMMQDQGVLHLCDGLTHQKSSGVKTLVLWNNQITRQGMIPMANLLSITQNIQTLNIGHNRLGNDGIRVLQSGLLKNRSLLRLGLLNTKITAEGAVALAEYVADTRSLLRLDLRENDLFVGGLMALTLAVKINETVVRIDLDKDLKKEQGMEGTQTSLLVDIYQYLERNKKLGNERGELRHKEVEKQNTTVDDVTNHGTVDNSPSDVINKKIDVDSRNSRFIVSPVHGDKIVTEKNNGDSLQDCDEGFTDSLLTTSMIKSTETKKLLDEADDHHVTHPTEFENELDGVLSDVSGVKTDLSNNLSKQDEGDEFWNKDVKEILKSASG